MLFLVCTVPFWTSNVIRMISWIPFLGRNGLVNQALVELRHRSTQPLELLLFSDFAVVLAYRAPLHAVHGRADLQLDDAHRPHACSRPRATPAPAAGRRCANVILPLAKPGIAIGSIFVVTLVMGDFVTVRRDERRPERLGRR